MNISEVIKNRTSLRVYDDRMVEDQDLEKILEAASLAPTAGNQQLYSVIVIKSQETKDKLSESCDHQPFIAKAPVLLLFVSDQKKWFDYYQLEGCKEFSEREPGLFWEAPNESDLMLSIEDTMIAAQNAVLMAESLGIGSCYIGDILENYEFHKELFALPVMWCPSPWYAWDIIRKAISGSTENGSTRNMWYLRKNIESFPMKS